MFHTIPNGSRIIGRKYGRFIWETPDKYQLMIASGDSSRDTKSVLKHMYKIGPNYDLKYDITPDEGSHIIELNNPGDTYSYDLELDPIFPQIKDSGDYLQNLPPIKSILDMDEAPALIRKLEGGRIRKAYIPKDKNGNVIGNSGVTVGTGVDLGQRNDFELRHHLKLSEPLIEKLKKYSAIGNETRTRKKAEDALKYFPLYLTEVEAYELDSAVFQNIAKNLAKRYNEDLKENKKEIKKIYGPFKNETRTNFVDMPLVPQEVIASVAYQFGPYFGSGKTSDLWKAFLSQNWEVVVAELKEMGKYSNRRKIEAEYLESWLKAQSEK